jgi:hypothetical protein
MDLHPSMALDSVVNMMMHPWMEWSTLWKQTNPAHLSVIWFYGVGRELGCNLPQIDVI